ncbi:helix-turn-helix domain-containing protein [Salinibius halmophilus]|uniref:helix-turn-helix domain-containing protein n=1 Tax=Salinibius halmophilus TaxID=1853216 RepID=UPI000E66A3B7|nr:AraC family transcriptional regulator [Salinibius halmophilus]
MLSGVTLGMCLLCLSRLLLQGERGQLSMIIAVIVLLFTWLSLGNNLMVEGSVFAKLFIASIPTVFYLMLPLVFFYQQFLVGNQIVNNKIVLQRKSVILHVVPTAIAMVLSLSILFMPQGDFEAMFFGDANSSIWLIINALFFGVLFIVWILISILYIINIISVSRVYQQKLIESFSNFSGKTLNWFAWFVALICFTWLYSLTALLAEDALSRFYVHSWGVEFLVLIIVWFFSLNSIQQKPVFPGASLPEKGGVEAKAEIVVGGSDQTLYANSALSDERLAQIAQKITAAVRGQQLYLNPDFSAADLASHLGISAHYLSQAFSKQLNTSFYGFVNTCRIAAAKQQLKDSENTVLDIALRVGFNSRSAFYNAFRKEVGVTPVAFRKSSNTAPQ